MMPNPGKGLAVIGTLLTLSSFSFPKSGWSSETPAPVNSGGITYELPRQSSAAVEFEEMEDRQIEQEIQNWSSKQGGIVVDSGGAAWTGEEIRLTNEVFMHVIVPEESAAAVHFHRFGYLGVVTEIFRNKGRAHRWNSDIGLCMEAGKDFALPFVNCADRSLDMANAAVTVMDTSGETPRYERGKLNSSGRYYSFTKSSFLRPLVEFKAGETVQVSVMRTRENGKDDIIFAAQGSCRKVTIRIPVKRTYLDVPRKMTAHRVVSAIPDRKDLEYRTRNSLAACSKIVPFDEMTSYPALRKMHSHIARETAGSPTQESTTWAELEGPGRIQEDMVFRDNPFLTGTSVTSRGPKRGPFPFYPAFISRNPALLRKERKIRKEREVAGAGTTYRCNRFKGDTLPNRSGKF